MKAALFAAVSLALLGGLTPMRPPAQTDRGARIAGPIIGDARLDDGRAVHYRYHFNHNGLAAVVDVGDRLVALSDSGDLMTFDRASLALVAQTARAPRATAIAALSSAQAVVGFEDGQVNRLDPVTLSMTPFARAEGSIAWLGTTQEGDASAARVVAIAMRRPVPATWWPGISEAELTANAQPPAATPTTVTILPDGPARALQLAGPGDDYVQYWTANVFAFDHRNRLWLGVNAGEFGGLCSHLDIDTGKMTRIFVGDPPGAVRGFSVLSDGRVLAYGGVRHMGMADGFIARVDRGTLDVLRKWDNLDELRTTREAAAKEAQSASVFQRARPEGPIDEIVEDRGPAGGYWVLSDQKLYHADASFVQWSDPIDLHARWVPFARAAVGPTPTVTTILSSADDPATLLCPTGRDGFVRVRGPGVERVAFDGQFETPPEQRLADLWDTSLGTLALTSARIPLHENGTILRLRDDAWTLLDTSPRVPPRDAAAGGRWTTVVPAFDDGGGVRSYWTDNDFDTHEHTWTRATGRTVEELAEWQSAAADEMFQGPDGSFWSITGSRVRRWQSGTWRTMGRDVRPMRKGRYYPGPFGRRLIALGEGAFPWLLYDVAYGRVFRIARGGASKALRIEEFSAAASRSHLGAVLSAANDSNGAVLLATTLGAFRLQLRSGHVERLGTPEADARVQSICRDGSGRVWVAGEKLHVSADRGATWTTIDALPMLSTTAIKRLWANRDDPEGVVLALDDRGVVFVTVGRS